MATRKVTIVECDRCHSEVNPDEFKANGLQIGVKPRGQGQRTKVWDLCPECAEGFGDFIART